ncbi:hypothetical protein [Limnobaculum xujianqingii]|uniref:hypothetical protein n=1 Tax=Limnobaculum xujianqingii TaxID=2738837 RepID=UPI00112A270D|nr:hypothetical protein [Limnobaculum xujianqingii]
MSESELMPSWECQPHLDETSVRNLLTEIANVLTMVPYHTHVLDSNWSIGVRTYDWVRNHLILNEGNILGLKMISKGLDYVMTLNLVPIQFSTDSIDSPKKKHRLLRNRVECDQLSLFGKTEPEQDLTWRVIAEPYFIDETEGDEDNTIPSWAVALVGINSYGAIVSQVLHMSGVSMPVSLVDNAIRPEEADIDDVEPRRRNSDVDSNDNQSEGTSGV